MLKEKANEGDSVDGIGKIIQKQREKNKISQNELCAGICSVATLSRVEWGEQNIGKWNIDVFLQRLGRSQDKFWTIVHVGDYEVMELRRNIWDSILYENYKKAEKGIREYRARVNVENLHEQFLLKCLGMIKAKREEDWEGALQLFEKAVRATVPGFQEQLIENLLIGRDEMQMILLMAEAYNHIGEEKTAQQIVEALLKNIRKKEWDEEELVKIYPKVVKVYTDFLKKEDKYEEVISEAKIAIEMLVDNGIIFLLAELLEKIVWGMERRKEVEERRFSIGEQQEYTQLKQQIIILRELWEEYGNFSEECMMYCTNVQKDISVSNEIIAKCRKLCNLSQEKLSENVCTVEQFSRIETGKCSPMEKSYRGLMEKMNQAQERNRFFINAQEYSLHEKIRNIEKKINGQEMRKAAEEWEKVKQEIPDNTLNNQQCIARYDTLMKYCNREIDAKQYIERLESALCLTMPEFKTVNIKNWPLSRNEILLLSSIANVYYTIGRVEEAKRIYYALWDSIEESETDKIYHITEYRLLAYNMGLMEGMEQNFAKAKEILDCGIRSCMVAGRIEMMPSFLYCYGWAIREERQEEKQEKARHILEQAFYLGNLLKLPNLCNEICDYYEEEWNDRITY